MLKLPIPNYFLIDVPMDAKVREVSKKIHISLPLVTKILDGNYRLISSNIATITEEEANGLGLWIELSELHSAFESVGADITVKRYVLIEKEGDNE